MSKKLRAELEEILENGGEEANPLETSNQSQNNPTAKLELRHAALALGAIQFLRFLKGPKN